METTALYVELIVIGMEAMSWISSFLVYFTDIQYLPKAVAFLGNLSASFFLLGILYALGMVVDRMADMLFQPLEDRARAKAKIQSKSTILIWKDAESYFQFTRSKLRILRASTMNFPITTIGILMNLSRYVPHDKRLFYFVALLGLILSGTSLAGYMQIVEQQFKKAKFLELKETGKSQGIDDSHGKATSQGKS